MACGRIAFFVPFGSLRFLQITDIVFLVLELSELFLGYNILYFRKRMYDIARNLAILVVRGLLHFCDILKESLFCA
jgi:hypothetical protein